MSEEDAPFDMCVWCTPAVVFLMLSRERINHGGHFCNDPICSLNVDRPLPLHICTLVTFSVPYFRLLWGLCPVVIVCGRNLRHEWETGDLIVKQSSFGSTVIIILEWPHGNHTVYGLREFSNKRFILRLITKQWTKKMDKLFLCVQQQSLAKGDVST